MKRLTSLVVLAVFVVALCCGCGEKHAPMKINAEILDMYRTERTRAENDLISLRWIWPDGTQQLLTAVIDHAVRIDIGDETAHITLTVVREYGAVSVYLPGNVLIKRIGEYKHGWGE